MCALGSERGERKWHIYLREKVQTKVLLLLLILLPTTTTTFANAIRRNDIYTIAIERQRRRVSADDEYDG